ncbi:MAG TPA: DUF6600 domain-containing protein [Myxococcales bacterium]
MKRLAVLIAILSLAAPVFAQDYGYGPYPDDDDQSWQQQEQVPPPDQGPTLDDFRDDSELSWNGEWVETAEYGTVWRPTRVREEWQPYMYGRWVWTRAGWAWASDEPFGWAVYHYGRWAWMPGLGWAWLPGRVWAPAWVAWRWNDGYTGWCPLGPAGAVYEHPARWVVVPNRQFLQPVAHYVVPRHERQSLPLPPPRGPRAGPPVGVVERATGRTVRPLAIGDGSSPSQARAGGGTVYFYRPRTAPIAAPPREARQQPGAWTAAPRAQGGTAQPPRNAGGQERPGATQPRAGAPRPTGNPGATRAPAPAAAPHATAPRAAPPRGNAQPRPETEQPHAKER